MKIFCVDKMTFIPSVLSQVDGNNSATTAGGSYTGTAALTVGYNSLQVVLTGGERYAHNLLLPDHVHARDAHFYGSERSLPRITRSSGRTTG
ncbi:hypothetical protein EBZ80_22050 [bacterium]|nr:hypothetical protein [bacterium]